MKKILLIEDDAILRPSLLSFLKGQGLAAEGVSSLREGRNRLESGGFDLLLLDWMLPDGEGLDFLKELRAKGSRLPIILLTARSEVVDRVLGLESGAQDYVTKPFEPRELMARIRARLRDGGEVPTPAAEMLELGPFRISWRERRASYSGVEMALTRMEFELLSLLMRSPGRVFTREELLNKVWGFDRIPTTRTVDTHVLMLRGKTDDRHFETVRGIGYRFYADLTKLCPVPDKRSAETREIGSQKRRPT
jgi:DNA-binding response OmpR family regulator